MGHGQRKKCFGPSATHRGGGGGGAPKIPPPKKYILGVLGPQKHFLAKKNVSESKLPLLYDIVCHDSIQTDLITKVLF